MSAQLTAERKPGVNGAALCTARPPGGAVINRLGPEDQVLLDKLLTEATFFVDHPDFLNPGMDRELFGRSATLVRAAGTRFAEPVPVNPALNGGARVPTLTHAEEQRLFMRFNYARRQVAHIVGAFADKKLTAPAMRQLLAWGHRALDARSTIVRVNMPLVLAMAKRTRLSRVDYNELISEGNMALLRSSEKFDCGRGYKFSTYSCRAILKSFSRVAMRASRYRAKFPTEFDANLERSNYVQECRTGVVEDCVDELKQILLKNLAELSDVERTVIRERFALGAPLVRGKPASKTLEQVGHIIGVTKERVRQIQNKALRKIRSTLEKQYLAA